MTGLRFTYVDMDTFTLKSGLVMAQVCVTEADSSWFECLVVFSF